MALYLVQHGKSLPKDIDPDQGISETGRAEVERIAAVAANYGIRIARIAHSGKKSLTDGRHIRRRLEPERQSGGTLRLETAR